MGCVTEWIARFDATSRPLAAMAAGGFQFPEPDASDATDRPRTTISAALSAGRPLLPCKVSR
jgi:hypothetical protein